MPYLEVVLVVGLILLNGLLAMSELAVASSRPARLKAFADRSVRGAKRALVLASDPGRFLSTVQIGITLIGILAGVLSGATLGDSAVGWLTRLGVPEHIAEPLGFGAVVTAITYLSLTIGELVPKQIALRNPERIACAVAPAMTLLARLAAPLVWLLDRSGRLVLALLGYTRTKTSTVDDAEIHELIAHAETAGVLEPEERSMIAGVMRLGDRQVRAVMTQRLDVDTIDLKDDVATMRRKILASPHSRLIVNDGSTDQVVGVVQAKHLLDAFLKGRKVNPRNYIVEAPVIPESMDALDVLAVLKKSPVHVGLVHDEYGHFQGLVTAADILEAIVGAFLTEEGPPEPAIVERDDGSFLISGSAPIDEVSAVLGRTFPEDHDYHTAAGFILEHLGRIPEVGESFTDAGWRFEVIDLDGRRIDKLLVSRVVPVTHRALTG
ncbi:MAG: hemolysin family protein [Pseudomonadota bacterium]|nr:hemolysin family protein [Pseudomonadota bacterium]